jgi:cell division protein FtsI (penicillin-binding protein 3)
MEKKLNLTFLIFFVVFSVLVTRLFFLQVVQREDLLKYSNNQFIRNEKVYPNRGHIYDRNLEPLAINVSRYSIFAIPKQIERIRNLRKLRPIIGGKKYQKIIKTIKRRNKFTWVVRNIELNHKEMETIKKMKGVHFERTSTRYYPNHELLSQTLGFVGVDNTGLQGLEWEFDKMLRGKPLAVKYHIDAKGRPIRHESIQFKKSAKPLILSIDKDIQGFVEKHLKQAVIDHAALKGGAAVMDSSTGEILAIANYPSFDPNKVSGSKAVNRKLSFVSDPFEPGSGFKTFTILSALENKLVNEQSSYYCEQGELRIGKHIIRESSKEDKHEWLSIKEILKLSSNIGTTKIAFDLGYPKLKDTLKKFGFGDKSGLELSSESRGIFHYKDQIKRIQLSNISFGQGIATTGIQLLAAYNVLANQGYWVDPTLIKGANESKTRTKLIQKEDLDKVNDMLTAVVEDGTGLNARVKGYQIAGKTGTAQKPSPEGGYKGYIPNFIGFPLKVKKPFVVFVYIDDPSKGVYYGNAVAAPVFQKIVEYILIKNNEQQLPKEQLKLAENQIKQEVKTVYSAKKMNRIIPGKIPNFIGLDKKSVLLMAKKLDINVSFKGQGIVKEQRPKAGTNLGKRKNITLFFRTPEYE